MEIVPWRGRLPACPSYSSFSAIEERTRRKARAFRCAGCPVHRGSAFVAKRSSSRIKWLILFLFILGAIWGIYGSLYLGPVPKIEISLDRPSIGATTRVTAHFAEAKRGLGSLRLEIVQGDRSLVLAEQENPLPSPFRPWESGDRKEVVLEGSVGRGDPEWLEEGEVTLLASASRLGGWIRSAEGAAVEMKVEVKLRPPTLSVLSGQHYVRQGGSGVVLMKPGASAIRSGVRAGTIEFHSQPLADSQTGARFALFAIPWDLGDASEIVVFAEDDAGNRAERPFIDRFKAAAPRKDTIPLPESFLQKVVPAITSQTPTLSTRGSLLERYIRINDGLRMENRKQIAKLSKESPPEPLWQGAFMQLPNSKQMAGFAEVRSYVYDGETVDTQTHLGLDFASVRRAKVPAVNSGRVVFADYLGIYGNAVVIDHGCGLLSVSAHLSSIAVESGTLVAKGETVGHTGATGLAGGDHLHFGLFIRGVATNPIEWLDPRWIEHNIASKLRAD